MSGLTLTLRRPVRRTGEDVTSLTYREPTGKDVRLRGVPVTFMAGGAFKIDSEAMSAHMAELSDSQMTTIDQMKASDWQEHAMALVPFFLDGSEGETAEVAEEVS